MPATSSKTTFTPQSHFFAGTPAFSQSESQAFGPVDANRFNLTAGFNISSEGIKAFAICSGIVLIQPQNESEDKVNLILRPYKQPAPGLNIKYFIYRGLKMSDFFNVGKVVPSSAASSDFINKINASFASFHTSISPDEALPDFLAKYIGFDPANQPDDLLLDYFFFKESEYVQSSGEFVEKEDTAFELPIIGAGKSLGTFAPGECGIDVVLSYGDYKLPQPNDEFVFNLNYARKNFARLDLAAEPDLFKKKLIKEQCTQFLDIAAWYGFHYKEGGYVTLDNAGTKEKKTGEQIYTDLLQSFYSRNRLYVYIQSDRTRSYNFYGNYVLEEGSSFSLKVGVTESGLVAKDFGTMGWPLLIDETVQSHSDSKNSLYLQLVTDNNKNTTLYGQVADIEGSQNGFCNSDRLLISTDDREEADRLTNVIKFRNPKFDSQGLKKFIVNFNILHYRGHVYTYKVADIPDTDEKIVKVKSGLHSLEEIFENVNATPLITATTNSEYSSLNSQRIKITNLDSSDRTVGLAAIQTVKVNDIIPTRLDSADGLKRITYITESIEIFTDATSIRGQITNNTVSSSVITSNAVDSTIFELTHPFYYTFDIFTDNFALIKGLKLKSADNTIVNKIMLGITRGENDQIANIITANNLTNSRICLVNHYKDEGQLQSTDGKWFKKYQIGIIGELEDSELCMYLSNPIVWIYSLDDSCFFSKEYSDYMNSEASIYIELDTANY